MNPIEITKIEWMQRGQKFYGTDDILQWEFRCPMCGHLQKPQDFQPYQDKGATPDNALWNCIGRFSGEKGGCDYTAYGLLQGHSYVVTDEEGHEFKVFAFGKDEEEPES